jgi:Flp pilus assembly protein TadD
VLRFALFALLILPLAGFAQNSAPNPATKPAAAPVVTAVTPTVPAQVLDAEASIAKSDWKSAQAVLDSWLATHPADPRALFDAGYVADAQNRMDDASSLYRRAIDADH